MNRSTTFPLATALLAGASVGLAWAFAPAAAAVENPPPQVFNAPCPTCPGGSCPFGAETRPAATATATLAPAAIERPIVVRGRQQWRPARNLLQRIRGRRHVTPQPEPSPAPAPSPLPPIPPIPPAPQPKPAAGLTAVVFEDVTKPQPWQGVVDKYAEDALRDKDGTSHYRRYDLSLLDKPSTPASIENRWQLVKSKPLPQIVIEDSGKLLFAGPEPQTVDGFLALWKQYQPTLAGTATPVLVQPAVRPRVRRGLFPLIRKAPGASVLHPPYTLFPLIRKARNP